MKQAVLLLGSNIEDRLTNLNLALIELTERIGVIVKKSSVYESEPWGFETENSFLNQVVVVETQYFPSEILCFTQEIEKKLGRQKIKAEYESRTIDIDILFFENLIHESETLIIPHPRLHKRKFTLEPLCEILPDKIHPVLKKTCRKLLIECEDNLWVKKFSN